MIYMIAGLVLTIVLSWAILKVSTKKRIKSIRKITFRQSTIYDIVKDFVPKDLFDEPTKITQSRKYAQKNMLKVIIEGGKAYWVVDNVFYVANAINGRIDESTVEPLDIINMPKKELDRMLDILDTLKMGSNLNDSGGSRNE